MHLYVVFLIFEMIFPGKVLLDLLDWYSLDRFYQPLLEAVCIKNVYKVEYE